MKREPALYEGSRCAAATVSEGLLPIGSCTVQIETGDAEFGGHYEGILLAGLRTTVRSDNVLVQGRLENYTDARWHYVLLYPRLMSDDGRVGPYLETIRAADTFKGGIPVRLEANGTIFGYPWWGSLW